MQYLPLTPRKMSRICNIGYMCMYTHKICFYENLNMKLVSENVKIVWYVTIQSSRWCYNNIFANLYFPSLLLHDHLPQKYLSDLKKTSNLNKNFIYIFFQSMTWILENHEKKSLNLNHHLFDIIYLYLPISFIVSFTPVKLFFWLKKYKQTSWLLQTESDCVQILRGLFLPPNER